MSSLVSCPGRVLSKGFRALFTLVGFFTSVDPTQEKRVMIHLNTRKSSCVNARGIPTAAYQVLYLLSYRGEVPHPRLGGGTPIMGYPPSWPGTSRWGTPQKGHGTSGSIMGWRWGTPPPPPRKDMGPVKVLWDGDGDGVTPPPPNRETPVKTQPSIVLRTLSVIIACFFVLLHQLYVLTMMLCRSVVKPTRKWGARLVINNFVLPFMNFQRIFFCKHLAAVVTFQFFWSVSLLVQF